jgi:hypothetical protein
MRGGRSRLMANLKIRVFKGNNARPDTTFTIPLGVLRVASKMIPKKAAAALEDKGIDVNQIVELSQDEEVRGTIVEIEEHNKNEKVIIAIE